MTQTANLVDEVKKRLEITTYIMRYVPIKKAGRDYKACCPFHQEKTPSFTVSSSKQSWHCFGGCQTGGDVISFAMKYHGWTFSEAIQELAREAGISTDGNSQPQRQRPPMPHEPEPPAEPPTSEWQQRAKSVVSRAEKTLWETDAGYDRLTYLRVERGLDDETIRAARLGYVRPENEIDFQYGRVVYSDWLRDDGKPIRVPCGITIPHFADGHLWALRVRTNSGKPKYQGVSGGSKALYWSDFVEPGAPVVMTEGEFDALVVWQAARRLWMDVCPVSIASASNKDINRRWYPKLIGAPMILARFDRDDAGVKALDVLSQLTHAVRAIQVPDADVKDINDYVLKHGAPALCKWLEGELHG